LILHLDLLDSKIQKFINDNIDANLSKLALQKNPFPNVNWISILNQIEAKKKSKQKLPSWFSTENIIYPNKISIEQTSSETTALYKSSIVSGKSLVDLTAGFGVDDFYFAQKIKKVVHCEINTELSDIVKHNFEQLNVKNIVCYSGDSLEILVKLNTNFEWIYIDPSRRNIAKGKVFMLKDCLPDVPENLELFFKYSNSILIKTSPLLDISLGLSELQHVKKIHIVAIDNEVKELLWELRQDFSGKINIQTVNITKEKNHYFNYQRNCNLGTVNYSLPSNYLYEPNSAIMKSGGFDELGIAFNLKKLHKHSHLYTSSKPMLFPGRVFEIEQSFLYRKEEIKQYLENTKANVTTRNFPDSVENIRKKWKIKEGGNQYCFFTTDINNDKIVLICRKIELE
jgi:hypothetical protein